MDEPRTLLLLAGFKKDVSPFLAMSEIHVDATLAAQACNACKVWSAHSYQKNIGKLRVSRDPKVNRAAPVHIQSNVHIRTLCCA